MVIVDHCGIAYERDEDNMKLWREGGYGAVGKGSSLPVGLGQLVRGRH